jgi:sulfhydrogenase subunit gamma (sulfur reductase)
MNSSVNTYIPYLMRIEKIIEEAPYTKTYQLKFMDQEQGENFQFQAGQFGEYSIFGEGESTFCIASSPTRREYIECTFRQAGRVTTALTNCETGDIIGFRGPYGNTFPLEQWRGKNLLFIAGGIGMAPLRCVIWNALDLRDRFDQITILYGARTVADLIYKAELKEWDSRKDVRLVTTVDPGGEDPDWKGEIGFVPHILKKLAPVNQNTIAIVCGPPIMIKLTIPILTELNFPADTIYTTLENRMKCGVGKCGHCMVGPVYVCKDGPVFTYEQMKNLPPEY